MQELGRLWLTYACKRERATRLHTSWGFQVWRQRLPRLAMLRRREEDEAKKEEGESMLDQALQEGALFRERCVLEETVGA